jgi:hypothetical protein
LFAAASEGTCGGILGGRGILPSWSFFENFCFLRALCVSARYILVRVDAGAMIEDELRAAYRLCLRHFRRHENSSRRERREQNFIAGELGDREMSVVAVGLEVSAAMASAF